MVLTKLALSAGATLAAYGVYQLTKLVIGQLNSPLRDLRGPESPSWFFGNLKQIFDAENSQLHEKWVQEYGSTISYKGLGSIHRLYTTDLKAINYILMNSDDFGKPIQVRFNLSRIFGPGILIVEGEQHRQQRRILNPAFGPAQIRELTPIFTEKANQLRDIWSAKIAKEDGRIRADVLSWLSKLTLDVIGLAGFHYKFDTLNADAKPNELNEAFTVLFRTGSDFSLLPFLQGYFPIFRFIVTERVRITLRAKEKMDQIGMQLLRESKAAAIASDQKDVLERRDLLSLLTRANMDKELPESQRLSDENVLAQVPTFLVAGHETTSNATMWALYALAIRPDIQTKLRDELFTLETETPTMDELNSLQYLDFVVRETLRIHSPVASTLRHATRNTTIPLGTPIVDRHGNTLDRIRVCEGDPIFIPIIAINRSKALWGEDAMEFRPERWEAVPEAAGAIPGIFSNLLTFLGGPRSCIGYRFSLVEMKAILFSLVKAFQFELAVPAEKIHKKTAIVQRPVVEGEKGNQMPMFITSYQRL